MVKLEQNPDRALELLSLDWSSFKLLMLLYPMISLFEFLIVLKFLGKRTF